MSRSRTEEERLDRLAGDGERGGGLPLPLLFAAILEELIDHESASTERLTEIIADKAEFKAQRVMEVWNSWDALSDDLLQQMAASRIVTQGDDGDWRTGVAFGVGRKLTVIPKRRDKNHGSGGVTVYSREERAKRGRAEEKAMTVTEYAQRLRDRGLREVSARRVEEIRESIREFGDHRDAFPVLVDQHGNLLDGRHRQAVDPDWPRRMHRVQSDEDMLQVALVANQSATWSRKDWTDLAHLVKAVGGQQQKREGVRAALLAWPDLTHNAIAKRLGASPTTVGTRCSELISNLEISECRHRLTEDGKQAPGPKPKSHTEAEARVEELLLGNPQQSNKQIQAAVGLSDNQHRVVERVRDRLEEAGAIPPALAREGSDGRVRRVPNGPAPAPGPAAPRSTAPPAEESAGAESAWSKIMGRFERITTLWRSTPPDRASEREELQALRRLIHERLAALDD